MAILRAVMRSATSAVVAFALIWLPGDLAHAQSTLVARYSLTLAGVSIGDGDWTVETDKDRYLTKSSARFFGVWRMMLGSGIAAAARGTTVQGRLAPANYSANFAWDEAVNDVQMKFRDGGVSDVATKPPAANVPDRIPVTAADLRDAIDPLTAGLVLIPGTGNMLAPAACKRTLPIFDGSHRFDMALSFKRIDTIKAETGYRGPAVVCAMTYRPVAGYSPGEFRVNYLKKTHGIEMTLAPIAGTRLLALYRMSIPTLFGTAVLGATRFESAIR